jgi:hypothetical protein
MLELTINYEAMNYSVRRPVSLSSWPTLDPLNHPTEIFTDEDKAAYDLAKIIHNREPGIFATPIMHIPTIPILSGEAIILYLQRQLL